MQAPDLRGFLFSGPLEAEIQDSSCEWPGLSGLFYSKPGNAPNTYHRRRSPSPSGSPA